VCWKAKAGGKKKKVVKKKRDVWVFLRLCGFCWVLFELRGANQGGVEKKLLEGRTGSPREIRGRGRAG